MLSILAFLLIMYLMIRFTGFVFRIAGRLLGWMLGGFLWLILIAAAVTVFGIALTFIPVILIAGIVSLAIGAAR